MTFDDHYGHQVLSHKVESLSKSELENCLNVSAEYFIKSFLNPHLLKGISVMSTNPEISNFEYQANHNHIWIATWPGEYSDCEFPLNHKVSILMGAYFYKLCNASQNCLFSEGLTGAPMHPGDDIVTSLKKYQLIYLMGIYTK